MALSANSAPPKFGGHTSNRTLPVAKNEVIWRGAAVGRNPAGYAKEFVPGDVLVGFAEHEFKADTTDGSPSLAGEQTSAGQKMLNIIAYADNVKLPVSGAVRADIGRWVYATDDATFSFIGHPDAIVGRVIDFDSSGVVICEMRNIGYRPSQATGSQELTLTGNEAFTATGATAGTATIGAFDFKTILGLGATMNDAEDGGHLGTFDGTAEVALASLRTRNDTLPIDRGLTFDVDFCLTDKGDASAIDVDIGFGTALTTNSEADIDHADMVQLAAFHLDGNSDDILAQSDDNTTDVAAVDTTINNDSTTDVAKHLKIIVRPSGAVEFWINGARVLASTTFAMLSTANVAAFINMEKTSDDTTAVFVYRNLRIGAGLLSA